ncbi:hypothetical protein F4604DRAFT_1911427 [Suillus subluteus]|nr:hypothetical protein F4604DRAFT_1911427 [Suillus subluteus]
MCLNVTRLESLKVLSVPSAARVESTVSHIRELTRKRHSIIKLHLIFKRLDSAGEKKDIVEQKVERDRDIEKEEPPGKAREDQGGGPKKAREEEGQGGTMKGQGGPERVQVRSRRSHEGPGGRTREKEAREGPGRTREDQEGPGRARKEEGQEATMKGQEGGPGRSHEMPGRSHE